MLKETEKQKLRTKLAEYEGTIPHMYLDAKGYVTVGVGHLIATVANAQTLPFIDNVSRTKATAAQIKAAFDAVSKQPKNRLASFYKAHTRLSLTQIEIDKLTNAHIEKFYKELKLLYPDFDKYPEEARLSLFDLIFNVGMTNLKLTWPIFNKAVKDKDWQLAADNSNRAAPVSAARNKYVKDLLEAAAKSSRK